VAQLLDGVHVILGVASRIQLGQRVFGPLAVEAGGVLFEIVEDGDAEFALTPCPSPPGSPTGVLREGVGVRD
jgi:hypothetical protein